MAEEQLLSTEHEPVDSRSTLGQCPRCAVPIPRALELIEYEAADGIARFAECPTCADVVKPQRRG